MSCSITTYCISNTGDPLLNDTYLSGGTHNGEPFYSGTTNGYVIYYTTSNQWCLSDVLDGICILSGKFPCTSVCPDISSEYLFSGVCPTTTTTTTIDCSVLDFEAIFDCEPITTTTTTSTSTTTTTTTTIPPDPCSGTSVDATIQILPTTTTTSTSTTTTTTLPVDRPCVFSGDVTFNTISGEIICPYSFEFQDCFNGMKYLTTSQIINPSGGTIDEFMVFLADVNGVSSCISYVGINLTEIGGDIITLVDGPYGFSNLGECILCVPTTTTTSTLTTTTSTTTTTTSTTTQPIGELKYFVFNQCEDPKKWVIQTDDIGIEPGDVLKDDKMSCWEYMYQTTVYPNLDPSFSVTFITGNYFETLSVIYSDCLRCQEDN